MPPHVTTKVCAYCGRSFTPSLAFRRFFAINPGTYCSVKCLNDHRAVRPVPSLATRFWRHVHKTNGCWLWTASLKNGYGQILTAPHSRGGTVAYAHRVSWELHYGAIPTGLEVCHECDNPICVRPDHLFLGTGTENMQDCSRKGRTTRGERSASAKLTEQQVREIRTRYAAGGISQATLGKEYGLAQATIRELLIRKTWKHID